MRRRYADLPPNFVLLAVLKEQSMKEQWQLKEKEEEEEGKRLEEELRKLEGPRKLDEEQRRWREEEEEKVKKKQKEEDEEEEEWSKKVSAYNRSFRRRGWMPVEVDFKDRKEESEVSANGGDEKGKLEGKLEKSQKKKKKGRKKKEEGVVNGEPKGKIVPVVCIEHGGFQLRKEQVIENGGGTMDSTMGIVVDDSKKVETDTEKGENLKRSTAGMSCRGCRRGNKSFYEDSRVFANPTERKMPFDENGMGLANSEVEIVRRIVRMTIDSGEQKVGMHAQWMNGRFGEFKGSQFMGSGRRFGGYGGTKKICFDVGQKGRDQR